jgi:hypothetical protein
MTGSLQATVDFLLGFGITLKGYVARRCQFDRIFILITPLEKGQRSGFAILEKGYDETPGRLKAPSRPMSRLGADR